MLKNCKDIFSSCHPESRAEGVYSQGLRMEDRCPRTAGLAAGGAENAPDRSERPDIALPSAYAS